MSSSRDSNARNVDGTHRPRTNMGQGHARYERDAQYPPIASHEAPGLLQYSSPTRQHPLAGRTYQVSGQNQTSAYQDGYRDVYAPSTYTAHQGSSHDIHQYDEYAGAYNRADLLGYQYSPRDSYQRTTDFVDNGQQNRAGGRFAYSDEAEQSGMDNAAEAIQDFDSRFSGTNNANAVAQGAQRGNRSSTRAQRNRPNYAYPGTIDYPTQNGGSRTQR
ncbi:hypothetical protein HG530_010268 [Fusarium avenaceum]|nr:hypothetical protein HG530_010268 [Fusarium avenaceum]